MKRIIVILLSIGIACLLMALLCSFAFAEEPEREIDYDWEEDVRESMM